MLGLNYLIDAKVNLNFEQKKWDIFFSAFNDSDRVRTVFGKINANEKYWIMVPEYQYLPIEEPQNGIVLRTENFNEADQIIETIGSVLKKKNKNISICIDITGLMRPQILFILRYLQTNNFFQFEMIYTEPSHYSRKEDTNFTLADVNEVKQVSGFEGIHNHDMSRDMLFIGIGYDHHLISRVILEKDSARVLQLHSLPSLSADMYQESLIRLDRANLPHCTSEDQVFFSSANDPYLTAVALSKSFHKVCQIKNPTNIYLTPLATKPQTLGFGLFYLKELEGTSSSIIFPYSSKYSRETSKGIGKTWLYPIYLK